MVSVAVAAAVVALIALRDPDRVNRQATYRSFSEALVARDYDRAFGLFDDETAAVFVDAAGLEAYVTTRDFFPIDYSIGVISNRIQTVRFTMENGSRREARIRVQGLDPHVVHFQVSE